MWKAFNFQKGRMRNSHASLCPSSLCAPTLALQNPFKQVWPIESWRLKGWGHQAELNLCFRYEPTRCCYQGPSYEVPNVWWKSDSKSTQQPSHRKKNHVFRLFGFDGNHTIRLLQYATIPSEVDCSSWHLKCARQKHEIYHPSIIMRSESRVEKVRKTDQQCWAAELVIQQVSAKEDIIVNLFRNDTLQEYLKRHITGYRCKITELHRVCVSKPQHWIRAICEGSRCCCPHQTVLPHSFKLSKDFSLNFPTALYVLCG